jgi:hypothetical protein
MSAQTTANPAATTDNGNNNNNSGSNNNAPASATSASGGGGSGTTSASTSRLSIPPTAAAGGITITQPPQGATSFFKIAPSQAITFAWNFTSLYSTPAHLTVSAVCENGNTYPIGPTDGIIDGTATSVVWDPYAWDQNHPELPLAPKTYTLQVWDDRGPNAARAPGLFEKNTALKFALYKPKEYTPISDGKCTPTW